MYYKIEKTSPTGLKITELLVKADAARLKTSEWVYNHGFIAWCELDDSLGGGVSYVKKPKNKRAVDGKCWEFIPKLGIYIPNLKEAEGQKIFDEIVALPHVFCYDLEQIIGIDDANQEADMAFAQRPGKYFGIWCDNDKITFSADLIAITETEYNQLFNTEA